jgi:hypothetical protein
LNGGREKIENFSLPPFKNLISLQGFVNEKRKISNFSLFIHKTLKADKIFLFPFTKFGGNPPGREVITTV